MAPLMSTLVSTGLPVMVAIAASSHTAAASGSQVCHNTSGECDDVGLLQHGRPLFGHGPGKSASSPPNNGDCNGGCQNGGRCVAHGNYCHCNGGWTGDSCELAEETCPYEPSLHSGLYTNGGTESCGLGFTVYPYSQPELWGTAYEGWETCGGQQQSPININTHQCRKMTVKGPELNTDYHGSGEEEDYVANNGHALQVDGNFGTLDLNPKTFTVANFHFHSPSEHTENGKPAAMEMHIVHSGSNGTAVVGIFFDVGKENKCLSKVLSTPPRAGCEKSIGNIDLNCFSEQLSGPWWSYMGSLTTPPCTEGLFWQVMQRRATISRAQLQAFRTRYIHNARPTQPLHGRKVTYHKIQ